MTAGFCSVGIRWAGDDMVNDQVFMSVSCRVVLMVTISCFGFEYLSRSGSTIRALLHGKINPKN